jgi:fructose-1,6-bisphosphatase/inositol monophosphatase family enzyme
MEWDTAAADIIVKEAGGVVLQAGKITGKGELLEDWKVRGRVQWGARRSCSST